MKFKPKKSLGQNFLIDRNIVKLIVDTVNISKKDIVLEVGPGTGKLTKEIILKKPKKIIVVEKDRNLSNELVKKFSNKIEIINDDILNLSEENLGFSKMIVFGNLPYNISTQILAKWIKLKNFKIIFNKLILMFQKEVADRIIAKTNSSKYGRLSVLSNWKLDIKKIKEISPNCFFPAPKVKSTLLLMEPKKKFINIKDPKNLEFITNIFFNQRRKIIKKPLKKLFKNYDKILKKLKIDQKKRPQNLDPETFYYLCKEYENRLF